uniref:Uncharacterized protein n=1 Tax=Meloidogyne incognita TaxID=6306 RepID=A0A914L8M1_MELIC
MMQKKTNIVEYNEFSPDFDVITLHWILSLDTIGVLKFLAYHGLIKNNMKCVSCENQMSLIKKKEDFEWYCRGCGKRKSVRDKSFFARSSLPISKLLALLYMWIEDFRNKNVVKELKLDKNTVVNWFNYCRLECDGSKDRRRIF